MKSLSVCSVLLSILLLIESFADAKPGKKTKPSTSIVCDKANLAKADLCGEKLFFVGKNARTFPTSAKALESYCGETNHLIDCVKQYTDKCARNDVQRNLANVMLYTSRSHNKGVCSSKTRRANMLTMSKCVNLISKRSTVCMNQMLLEFGQALVMHEQKYRVPYACCSFHKMRGCIMDAAGEADPKVCHENAKEHFENYIGSMAGNTLELMCSDYDAESNKCLKIKQMPYNSAKVQPPKSLLEAFGNLLVDD